MRHEMDLVFGTDSLLQATPQELKYFANANLAGNPGNMSVFNTAWNEMGDEVGARRVKDAIDSSFTVRRTLSSKIG